MTAWIAPCPPPLPSQCRSQAESSRYPLTFLPQSRILPTWPTVRQGIAYDSVTRGVTEPPLLPSVGFSLLRESMQTRASFRSRLCSMSPVTPSFSFSFSFFFTRSRVFEIWDRTYPFRSTGAVESPSSPQSASLVIRAPPHCAPRDVAARNRVLGSAIRPGLQSRPLVDHLSASRSAPSLASQHTQAASSL